MLKTKCLYDPAETSDGIRILVSRYWPRGMQNDHFDIWAKELAPSKELLDKYKNKKMTWAKFVYEYRGEMQHNPESLKTISKLKTHRQTVTVLCYEQEDNPRCHRHILKQIIENEKTKSSKQTSKKENKKSK